MDKRERRNDLDWLRVLAVLLLVPFHSALIFSLDPGDIVYVKDQVESPVLIHLAYFVHQWHMSLLFVIAGASTWFALRFRAGWQYLKERFTRLVVPLLFGVATLIPAMIYVQFLGRPSFGSFGQFYGQFFRIDWGDLSGYSGTFTPAHLWFVLFLFVYCVAALPLFLYLRRERGRRLIDRLASLCERPGAIFAIALPLAVLAALPDLGGMPPFLYFGLFVLGYVLMADPRFQGTLDRHTASALIIGLMATAAVYVLDVLQSNVVLIHLTYYLSRWCWVVAFLGLGHRCLKTRNGFLRYASQAAYPFYILHFPVNTIVAHFVVQWTASIAVKYLAINMATILLTATAYEVLVKRNKVTRFLFGMKPRKRREPVMHPVGQRGQGVSCDARAG